MAMMNQVKDLYEQAVDNLSADKLKDAQEGIKNGASSIFDAARNNPKTTAAVILGTGLAAAALWVLREPQRLAAVKRSVSARMSSMLPHRASRGRTTRVRSRTKLP